MIFGSGKFTYELVEGWGKLPSTWTDWTWGWIVGLACDSQDRIFVYSRSERPLLIFDRAGDFLESWGDGILTPKSAHGIYIDATDNVYLTDAIMHAVYKFNAQGEHIWTWGTPGQPPTVDGEPFNMPTDLALAANGDVFISDGYGNACVHKFSPEGELLRSWGERGKGPGQFSISHCVRIDKRDRVWICDRENNRIQIFDLDGNFLTEWTGLLRPNTVYFDPQEDIVYIAELTRQISIYQLDVEDLTGTLLSQWGGAQASEEPGFFCGGPHGLWTDSHGDLYVGEVELGEVGRMYKYERQNKAGQPGDN